MRGVLLFALVGLARVAAADATLPRTATTDARARPAIDLASAMPVAETRAHLLVRQAGSPRPSRVALVVRRGTLALVAALDDEWAAGLVEDAAGTLHGVLSLEPAPSRPASHIRLRLTGTDGRTRWRTVPLALADSVTTLVAGDLLVVATFERYGTRAELHAVDRRTGALRWSSDVLPLEWRRSANGYGNDVRLALDGERVVLRSDEASGRTERLFDVATGRRL